MRNCARALSNSSKTWGLASALLGLGAPVCLAEIPGVNSTAGKLGLTVFVLLVVTLIGWLVAWQTMSRGRNGMAAIREQIQCLEREKAELMRAQEEMRHHAEHDDLTGLWNHRIIMERLRQEVGRSMREGTPLSVIMVDLDHFKKVNDSFGHRAGDMVLKAAAAVLQRSVRAYDWVGRYGGEEFLLILPGSGFAGAHVRAEQLRRSVADLHVVQTDVMIPVTASFGVASGFPTDCEELIHAADAALYRAKADGRNCVMAMEVAPVMHTPLPQWERRPSILHN